MSGAPKGLAGRVPRAPAETRRQNAVRSRPGTLGTAGPTMGDKSA